MNCGAADGDSRCTFNLLHFQGRFLSSEIIEQDQKAQTSHVLVNVKILEHLSANVWISLHSCCSKRALPQLAHCPPPKDLSLFSYSLTSSLTSPSSSSSSSSWAISSNALSSFHLPIILPSVLPNPGNLQLEASALLSSPPFCLFFQQTICTISKTNKFSVSDLILFHSHLSSLKNYRFSTTTQILRNFPLFIHLYSPLFSCRIIIQFPSE